MSDAEQAKLSGLSRACHVLAAGGAAIVPNAAPMAYSLVATRAGAINAAKRRPVHQNVAVSLHNRSEWQRLASSIDLPPASLDGVVALLSRRLTVLVPLRGGVPHPGWVLPAVRDGHLAAFNGHWATTAGAWNRFPRLYGSSANITGEPPAVSAAQAVAMFGPQVPVIDACDPWLPQYEYSQHDGAHRPRRPAAPVSGGGAGRGPSPGTRGVSAASGLNRRSTVPPR